MLTRREFSTLMATSLAGTALCGPPRALAATGGDGDIAAMLAEAERSLQARLGVCALDSQTGRRWQHRADERFPMCSTFKVVACGALLARVDAGMEDLSRRIRFQSDDLVSYSPVTKNHVGGEGMTLSDICAAALTLSDNTAGNLILGSIGGPAGVTDFARSLGDAGTRLDRIETELNEATPGDPRDTTTPAGMVTSLHALLAGGTLSAASRQQLAAWMVASKTGDSRLRAGMPKEWRIGDKTGTGDYGTANDIAVIWPIGRQPLFIAVYITQTEADLDERNATIAAIGRAIAAAL
ncbi:beta-lactamase [Aureimonas sp. SA4125]|uniref:class A beta-lactamase n=1 Tax=Aureimonas sp. SA4125 TaxID=2826993 RepID=UPI001CC57D2D|nr:class A beta-lactamase [Aureimonas sp. SA4125]BDA85785.1 beta-lactamase [Aureimonas sp. SA4125]